MTGVLWLAVLVAFWVSVGARCLRVARGRERVRDVDGRLLPGYAAVVAVGAIVAASSLISAVVHLAG